MTEMKRMKRSRIFCCGCHTVVLLLISQLQGESLDGGNGFRFFFKEMRKRTKSDTYATEEMQTKAGVFNENRKKCEHAGEAYNDMFTCAACNSLMREFNVVEVDLLLKSGSVDVR